MDNTVSSSALPGHHESHEVHLCHRCGWPFPNPHPSAKHRRAHKRVCGTLEGYTVIHSQEDGHHFSVSDDEHTSDDDDVHNPSPKPVEKSDKEFPGSSVIGEKTKRSEEDVFSDAVTEFGDSGVNPQMERFFSFAGDDKFVKQERVETVVYSNSSQKVEDTSDRTEPLSDPTSSVKLTKDELPLKALDQSIDVAPTMDKTAEAVSSADNDCLQLGVVKSGILEDVAGCIPENSCHNVAIEGKEYKLDSVNSVSEEVTVPTPGLISVESNELCNHPVSEVVVDHDLPEDLRNGDATSVVENVAYSAEAGLSSKIIGEISLSKKTNESDTLVVEKTGLDLIEEIGSITDDKVPPEGSLLSVNPGGSTQPSDSMDGDLAVSVSSESKMVVVEAICPSTVSVATNSQEHKTTVDGHQNKADVSEPRSFIASADCGVEGKHDEVAPAASETEKVASPQHPKSDASEAVTLPSQTEVVVESEGSRKNEEIIGRSPVRQHSPLKNLLDEVKLPSANQQVPSAYQKDGMTGEDFAQGPKATGSDAHKDIEEWNSPARYPIEIKKEKKKKGKSYWVPFVCCSSVHRDL